MPINKAFLKAGECALPLGNTLKFRGVDQYALLVAALCHDIGHQGRTNPFLAGELSMNDVDHTTSEPSIVSLFKNRR